MDIYVLNENLQQVGTIDDYTSLIWAKRYNDIGDCELYVQATPKAIDLLRKGYYLTRLDDDMVCRIKTIEIDTNIESGNYLIVTGYDVKDILNQRIVWSQTNIDGTVEAYIRRLVYQSIVAPNLSARHIPNFQITNEKGFKDVILEQVTYANVGEKVQELCKKYQWGYRVYVENETFYFDLYKGTDRSDYVVFSPEYENLVSTKYKEDSSNLGNVALIGGSGEGSDRVLNVSSFAIGLNRYEIFVDAKDVSNTITWLELHTMYPTTDEGGQGYIYKTGTQAATYRMNYIDIAIVDAQQLVELKQDYPNGNEQTIGGVLYYRIYDAIIADLDTFAPTDTDSVRLRNLVYSVYLLNRGYEKLSEYGTKVTFEGSVEPNVTFKYKYDYTLGDIVTVENEYGIKLEARIVEVIETFDEKGYSVEPKFEYMEVN